MFDTQVAAGFAGLRAQLGYEALLPEMVGVRLRKSARFTRWDTRPLSEEQVGYAREDVLHLLQVADALQGALERPRAPRVGARGVPRPGGRLRRARASTPSSAACRASTRWTGKRAVACELVAWREDTARADGPPGAQRARRRGARRDRQRRPRRQSACARSAASTSGPCAAAAAGSSRRSPAGASATPIPVDGRAASADRRRGRPAHRPRRGARAHPRR